MTRAPFWEDSTSALYVGDAREVLSGMPGGSADCIVTSPPYWGKRDYGVAGQYGSEPDPAAYVETLRATFAEARRVLADDGHAGSTSATPNRRAPAPPTACMPTSARI
jgi:DNA modification methylase